jgi:hypothetical protein
MTGLKIPDKEAIEKQLLNNPDILKDTIKKNPALLDYIFSDADIQRKYVKINPKLDRELKKISNETGVAEGVFIGLGLALLIWLLFKDE